MDLNVMKSKIYSLEVKTNKMDEIMKFNDNNRRSTLNNRL